MLGSFKFAVLAAALALGAGAAKAEEAVATAPVASAQAPAAASMTAEQIDQWIRSAPPPSVRDEGVDGVTSGKEQRKQHSMISATVGSGGYSNVTMATAIPLGETGLLSVAVSQSKGGRHGGYGYGYGGYGGPGYGGFGGPGYGYGGDRQSFSLGLALGDSAGRTRSRPNCDAPDRNDANSVRIYRPEDGLAAYDPVGCSAPGGRD